MKDYTFLDGLSLDNAKDLKRKFGYYLDPKRVRVGKNWDKLSQQKKRAVAKQLDHEFERLPPGSGFGYYVDKIVDQYLDIDPNKPNFVNNSETKKEYIPQKEDCDKAIKELYYEDHKVSTEEVLDRIEKNATSQGFILKKNWRIITKENMKNWKY